MNGSVTEKYKQMVAANLPTTPIVKVACPSGFEIEMHQPPVAWGLFGLGSLPKNATVEALEAWAEQELGTGASITTAQTDEQKIKVIRDTWTSRDRVLALSHNPKIVLGDAKEDELSANDLCNQDIIFLIQWVNTGGAGLSVGTFPGERVGGVGAGADSEQVSDPT